MGRKRYKERISKDNSNEETRNGMRNGKEKRMRKDIVGRRKI